jgi:phosphoribosyl 1,2-cyclic phosphodiesterase
MRYAILASGSKGNATVVEAGGHYLLIDMGLPFIELQRRLQLVNLTFAQMDAVLVTHEHIDHIRSLHRAPLPMVYASNGTCDHSVEHELCLWQHHLIAGVDVLVVPTSHDVVNGVGFVLQHEGETLVYITDTGYLPEKMDPFLANATHYILESNHDVRMLLSTERPQRLKKRILSDSGHLSNEAAAEALCRFVGPKTRSIVLAHVSEEANTPALAHQTLIQTFTEAGISLAGISVQVAAQHDVTKGEGFWE